MRQCITFESRPPLSCDFDHSTRQLLTHRPLREESRAAWRRGVSPKATRWGVAQVPAPRRSPVVTMSAVGHSFDNRCRRLGRSPVTMWAVGHSPRRERRRRCHARGDHVGNRTTDPMVGGGVRAEDESVSRATPGSLATFDHLSLSCYLGQSFLCLRAPLPPDTREPAPPRPNKPTPSQR